MGKFTHLVFRGDENAYARRDGCYPYVDNAARAGATGVHIWFWNDAFRREKDLFLPYCRDRNIQVHLGIGVGAYNVCAHEDPTDRSVRRRIEEHVKRTVEEFDIAGIELQTGEYDGVEYRGASTRRKTLAFQVAEQLNPIIECALALKDDLWVRTELNANRYDSDGVAEVARSLDGRCTVEWSYSTGPYPGPDAFDKGRSTLASGKNFSWFLKIQYRNNYHWREFMSEISADQVAAWIDHWRGWVRLLHHSDRRTLTVCNVSPEYIEQDLPLPSIAVAIAEDPDIETAELVRRYL